MSMFRTWVVSLDEMHTAKGSIAIAVVIASYATQLKNMAWCDSCSFAWDNMTRVAKSLVLCYNMSLCIHNFAKTSTVPLGCRSNCTWSKSFLSEAFVSLCRLAQEVFG